MKFAKCNYGSFVSNKHGMKLAQEDLFIVTPEFEKSDQFKEGIRTNNFECVEINTIDSLKMVKGVTDEMIEGFTPPGDKAPEDAPDKIADKIVEKTMEEPPEDISEPEDEKEITGPAFTELAKSWQEAVKWVKKETDVKKLNYALTQDERVSVKKAINSRLIKLKK